MASFVKLNGYDVKDKIARDLISDITNDIDDINENLSDIIQKIDYADITINVKEYGAKGDGLTDDTLALQDAFSKEEENTKTIIYFPSGTYLISAPLNVPSNTTILFSNDAILKVLRTDNTFMNLSLCFGEFGNTSFAGEYEGVHDVQVLNMKFDGGYNENYTSSANSGGNIGLSHCKNILFYNCEFYNMVNDHYLDVAGCYNVKIDNCIFRDTIALGNANYEAINIDWSSANGFPHFGFWDNTPCQYITIKNCYFKNLYKTCSGIGTHYMPNNAYFHRYINIENNIFINMSYTITLMAVYNAIITNNNFDNCSHFEDISSIPEPYTTWFRYVNSLIFSNNNLRDFDYGVMKIENLGGSDTDNINCLSLSNNVINNVNRLGSANGVSFRLRKISGGVINNNVIRNATRVGFWISDSENLDVSHNQFPLTSQLMTQPTMYIGNLNNCSFLFNKSNNNNGMYNFYGSNSNILTQSNYEINITKPY